MNKTLISIIGGLSGMFGWGISDFFANEASDKVGHTKALFWSQLAGLGLIGLAALLFASDFVLTGKLIFLMVISGVAYTFGYLLFYKGFEIGNVSVVSAVVNFQNIFIILISYFVFGQTLTRFQIPALLLILLGITLVSVNFKDFQKGTVSLVKGVKETLMAAALFGIFFWPLNEYVTERADWIIVSFFTKVIAILTILVVVQIKKQPLRLKALGKPNKHLVKVLITVGVLEALAILGVSFGVSLGDAIIVGPISSSLTIVTVTMAMIFLKEKIAKSQAIGIVITILGIILTAF